MASSPETGNPACSSTPASASSSSGYTGESITNPSSPARTTVHVVCQNAADQDDQVGVDADRTHTRGRYETPSSFIASRRFATSASGFFWLDSSVSLSRLTHITGTFRFRHGSTS